MTKKYMEIPLAEAESFAMPFGKYEGKTLHQIMDSPGGLKYLDWLRSSGRLDFHTNNAVNTLLSSAEILELIQWQKEKRNK